MLVAGHDFYACPRFSPDGPRLLWIAWRHPQMPWEATEFWVADVVSVDTVLRLTNAQLVAGGDASRSFNRVGSLNDAIVFVSGSLRDGGTCTGPT